MGFNFPNNPVVDQVYQPPGGPAYYWDGITWRAGPSILRGTAEPYNIIVNPSMSVSQENGDTSSPYSASGSYWPADQWLQSWNAVGAQIRAVRSPTSPIEGSAVINLYHTVAKPSIAASEYVRAGIQRIEGSRMAALQWGTPAAKPAVLRFQTNSNLNNFTFGVSIVGNNRSYIKNFVHLTANTPQTHVLAIPGDTTVGWNTGQNDTGTALTVRFEIAAGTNFQGVEGWQDGDKTCAPGIGNFLATAPASFSISNVGLYIDPQGTGLPPPFEVPAYADEVRACQRYWYGARNITVLTSATYISFTLPVAMRVMPTITGGGAGFAVALGHPDVPSFYQTSRAIQLLSFNARM